MSYIISHFLTVGGRLYDKVVDMALHVTQVSVVGLDNNFSYIVHCDSTKEALLVDPSGDFARVAEQVQQLQVTVVGILITHTHRDHIDALTAALELFPAAVFVHETGVESIVAQAVQPLVDGNEIELGDSVITVLHTPGHSPDAVCYFFATTTGQPVLISGDTLFIDGCGRTNDQMVGALYDSLQLLKTLPSDTVVFPGHDYGPVPADTLANQLLTNRFLQATTLPDFCMERLGYTVDT